MISANATNRLAGANWLLVIVAVASAAFYHLLFASVSTVTIDGVTHWHTNDDPMITLRVAQNFFETGKPYFNHGEAVAANTSLFWPMVLAGLYAFADNVAAVPLMIWLSTTISAAAVIAAVWPLRGTLARLMTGLAIAISPSMLRYAHSGWEHIPQTLFVTIAMALIWRASEANQRLVVPTSALLWVSAAFLLRADTAPTVAVVAFGWLATNGRVRQPGAYLLLLTLCILPAGYLLGMQYYYGDFVPNTAHLKLFEPSARFAHGIKYVANPHLAGIVPFLVLGLALMPPVSAASRFILAAASAHLAFVVYVGGDLFTLGRFFLVYLPILLSLSAATVLMQVTRIGPGFARMAAGAPLVLVLAWQLPYLTIAQLYPKARYGSFLVHTEQIRAVRFAAKHLDPSDGSIGLHFLGIGYHVPEFHVVDFLGKAEPVIARRPPRSTAIGHNKWDYAYAFSTYSIAAVPFPNSQVGNGLSGQGDQAASGQFWTDALAEMTRRGYVYLTPERIGNPSDGYGLMVRENLENRFPSQENG